MNEAIKYVIACACRGALDDPIAYIDDNRPTGKVTIAAPTPGEKQVISATGWHPEIEDWRAPDAWVANKWGDCRVTEIMWTARDQRDALIGWAVRCGHCSQQAQINQANLERIADRMAANLDQAAVVPTPNPISPDDAEGSYDADGWFVPGSEEIPASLGHRYVIQLSALIAMAQRNA
jgi:hypothetical protein